MLRSRTIKTLAALLVTMTVGSLALVAMETAPIRPEVTHLAAVIAPADDATKLVSATAVPLRRATWRNIVIHSSVEGEAMASQCHFVVRAVPGSDGQYVQATGLWKQQQAGRHLSGKLADESIGIFVTGRFDTRGPSASQFGALTGLAQGLQQACGVNADRVYLARELDPRCGSPGKMFPLNRFNATLLAYAN